jgi:D-alanyl-D-alanine carboxypeptidase
MSDWFSNALVYAADWIDFQRNLFSQPGVALAIARDGEMVLEHASGVADLRSGEPLTPRHRFRVASHSKTFTAAGIMLLREDGGLRLDDRVGDYVSALTPAVADVTIAQLLTHTAGLSRDGRDGGQFVDRRPFLDETGRRADLQFAPALRATGKGHRVDHGPPLRRLDRRARGRRGGTARDVA